MDILSWICLDLRKTEDLLIRKEIRWKNSWFKFGAELQRQLPKYLICFVWNTTFVVYKVNNLPPTSSVIKGHFRRNVFSLQHKCSITGVMEYFQQDSTERKQMGRRFWNVPT